MIGYHCSFEHRDVRYALLEYADKHTLEDFMMHKDSIPPSTNEEILSFWENILCVIEAILEIHDLDSDGNDTSEPGKFTGYNGRRLSHVAQKSSHCHSIHQDIKPKNILVKSKEYASSIYDSSFGLADLGTSSMVRATSHRAPRDNYGTKTYGATESSHEKMTC